MPTRAGYRPVIGCLERLAAAGLLAALLAGTQAARAASCQPDGQGDVVLGAGACTVGPGSTISRVTAQSGGQVTAGSVTVSVPYGNGVSALSGGQVIFNDSLLFSRYGGGGIIGLLASGSSSLITATGSTISLAAGGNGAVQADSGGRIVLSGGGINLLAGGGSQALYATGDGSSITAEGVAITGSQLGGGGIAARSTQGAAILLTDSTVNLRSNGGGETGLQADAGGTLVADGVTLVLDATGGDVGARAIGGGTLTMTGGSVAVTGSNGGEIGLLASGAGSTLGAAGVAVSVPASAGGAGVEAANAGTVTLGDGSSVETGGAGSPGLLATGTGSAITATGATVATTGATAPGGVVQNGAMITVDGGRVSTAGAGSFGFLLQGSGTNTLSLDETTLGAAADAFRVQGTVADITVSGSTVSGDNGVLLSSRSGATTTLDAAASDLTGAITTDAASTATVTLADGTLWTMTGSSNMTTLANDDSTIAFTVPSGDPTLASSYKTLTVGSYTGTGGTVVLNAYLDTDGSPSDLIVIKGGTATGNTGLDIRNTTGEGAETTANGILVVQATNGGTTAPDAFALQGEARAGAFDYFLYRGGLGGSSPDDWFLRSSFTVGPGPPTGPEPPPGEVFPEDPPPELLPPGTYPIIGPELATDGVVQPLARELGLAMLGTLHERIGDTLTGEGGGTAAQGWARSAWGRYFGEQIDNRYESYVSPSVSGRIVGFQAGFDVWRGSLIPGHRDAAGVYVAYANSNADVEGLVTNAAATGYVPVRTGSVNLNAFSGGLYWTHYGPTGWYLDTVLQGTIYDGDATTAFAELPTRGDGFIASLEGGYPLPLPLGPHFVLEPQAQILWQRVSFARQYDGLGSVELGESSGTTGRVGLRGQWTIERANGEVWQPYGRVNLWHDWDGGATTTFAGVDQVPLREAATRLELAGGLTTKLTSRLRLFAQGGYEFAVGQADDERLEGIRGDIGLRYVW